MKIARHYKAIAVAAAIACGFLLFPKVRSFAISLYPAQGLYYQSPFTIAGLSLIDVRLPPQDASPELPIESQINMCCARGIIAISPAIAVGFVAIGGMAVGVLSVGLLSLGVCGAIGVIGLAGYRAYGVLAIAPKRADASTTGAAGRTKDRHQSSVVHTEP